LTSHDAVLAEIQLQQRAHDGQLFHVVLCVASASEQHLLRMDQWAHHQEGVTTGAVWVAQVDVVVVCCLFVYLFVCLFVCLFVSHSNNNNRAAHTSIEWCKGRNTNVWVEPDCGASRGRANATHRYWWTTWWAYTRIRGAWVVVVVVLLLLLLLLIPFVQCGG
jgi:hypothetical protein